MKSILLAYGAALIAMAVLDAAWLGFIAKPLYQQGIGHLMADKPNIPVAVSFYLLFPIGLMVFVVQPERAWSATLAAAAMYGFFTYATYDLSNLATLRGWPVSLAAIDIAWGTFISTVTGAAAKFAFDAVR